MLPFSAFKKKASVTHLFQGDEDQSTWCFVIPSKYIHVKIIQNSLLEKDCNFYLVFSQEKLVAKIYSCLWSCPIKQCPPVYLWEVTTPSLYKILCQLLNISLFLFPVHPSFFPSLDSIASFRTVKSLCTNTVGTQSYTGRFFFNCFKRTISCTFSSIIIIKFINLIYFNKKPH